MHFVLEPFYKVIAVAISEEKTELEPILNRLGVFLKKKDFQMDIKPLVKLVLRSLLGDMTCFTDLLVGNVPHTRAGTIEKVRRLYQAGADHATLPKQLEACDAEGPLCINIVKLFNNELEETFYAYGRVISGTIKAGQDVRVLGEAFTLEEEEDVVVAKATKLWILQAGWRFKISVPQA